MVVRIKRCAPQGPGPGSGQMADARRGPCLVWSTLGTQAPLQLELEFLGVPLCYPSFIVIEVADGMSHPRLRSVKLPGSLFIVQSILGRH